MYLSKSNLLPEYKYLRENIGISSPRCSRAPKTSQMYGYTFLGVLLKNRDNNADGLKFTSWPATYDFIIRENAAMRSRIAHMGRSMYF